GEEASVPVPPRRGQRGLRQPLSEIRSRFCGSLPECRAPLTCLFVSRTTLPVSPTSAAYPRATRSAGRERRRALLNAAGRPAAGRAMADVSAAEIAQAAGAFPSQVTYYFGSKEALFVEAACRNMLHAAADVERAGSRARTPRTYFRSMVQTALASPA